MKKIIGLATMSLISWYSYGQQKIPYEFPAEMLPEVQKEYIKLFDKGRILYQMNCSSCHSSFKKRKEIIPDFTLDQLNGYAVRVSNPRHEENLPETQVTPEELGLITTFLVYKKRNAPAKK
jgi:hypothetical protein